MRFLNITDKPPLVAFLFQARIKFQIQHIRDAPTTCTKKQENGHIGWWEMLKMSIELVQHHLGNVFYPIWVGIPSRRVIMWPDDTSHRFMRSEGNLNTFKIGEK